MAKRRIRSPHPGVKIKKRTWASGATSYIAIFNDPDDGRERSVSLTGLGLSNAETRKDWAIRKSREIAKRKEAIELGAQRKTQTKLAEAIDAYLNDRAVELRPRTVEAYGESVERLKQWALKAKIAIVEQLSPPHLAALRSHLMALPKRTAVRSGRRGERMDGVERRSATSVNRDLRGIKTMLNEWRRRGLTPLLHSDDIADCLRFQRVPQGLKEFLDQEGLATLLQACLRHDAETYSETRAEHRGEIPRGTTRRYREVTPFVLVTLLTGCRLGEVTALKWSQVSIEHGYISLDDAAGVKTARGRRITLDETPLLATLFSCLKLAAGGEPYVFGGDAPVSREIVENSRARLARTFGAPKFNWQMLRRTCGTFLTCSDGLYRGSSAWMSAARLGHSVEVAQRHYVGALRNIPRNVNTLEQAMGLDAAISEYLLNRFGISIGNAGEFSWKSA